MSTSSPNPISIRKAAILVATLDSTTADTLLDALDEHQAALVRNMVVSLDEIDADERRQVLAEFLGRPSESAPSHTHEELSHHGTPDDTGVELDASLASRIAADDSSRDEACGQSKQPRFEFLQQADSAALARLLRDEHPQTVAVVLAYLPREQAAELLAMFPAASQTAIVRRLADLDETDAESLAEVERGLEALVSHHIRQRQRRQEGMQAIAGILAAANPQSQQAILAALGSETESDPAAATYHETHNSTVPSIRFADLAELTPDDLLTLVRAVDPEFVTLAMAAADSAFTHQVLGLLPAKVAQSLRHELNHLGPTRLSDLEDARDELVRTAIRLQREGSIKLPRTRLSMAA